MADRKDDKREKRDWSWVVDGPMFVLELLFSEVGAIFFFLFVILVVGAILAGLLIELVIGVAVLALTGVFFLALSTIADF